MASLTPYLKHSYTKGIETTKKARESFSCFTFALTLLQIV